MSRSHIKVRLLDEELEMAEECAKEFFDGNLSRFIRRSIREWYKYQDEYRKFEEDKIERIRGKISKLKRSKRRALASREFRVEVEKLSTLD